ncbi:hypothetical protein [Anabaena lutea]|uniref:DUF4351 domain-containing protein n=1 Tax=Anabaena lutea FACHB-196 TaxID=2692881 RepID=A0ABR8FIH4_9NOST|nr:hypothetical protein [Anabaena lutea]MBD2569408.1 hypothetical protein [Anabaena lutea FACHB-196]
MNNQLYEQDFNLWRETIIEKIKKQHFHESKNAKLGVRKPDESEYTLDFPLTLEQLLDEDFYGDVY